MNTYTDISSLFISQRRRNHRKTIINISFRKKLKNKVFLIARVSFPNWVRVSSIAHQWYYRICYAMFSSLVDNQRNVLYRYIIIIFHYLAIIIKPIRQRISLINRTLLLYKRRCYLTLDFHLFISLSAQDINPFLATHCQLELNIACEFGSLPFLCFRTHDEIILLPSNHYISAQPF